MGVPNNSLYHKTKCAESDFFAGVNSHGSFAVSPTTAVTLFLPSDIERENKFHVIIITVKIKMKYLFYYDLPLKV